MKKLFRKFLTLILMAVVFVTSVNLVIVFSTRENIYKDISKLPDSEAVLILGARVYSSGKMGDIFLDRVDTALEVYQKNKSKKIIVSGDHGTKYYDEVNVVKDYLLEKGVPGEDIFLDHAGFDTYDSVYRAKNIFLVSSLVVSTQDFHLARAVYIGESLGLDVVGISADKRRYIFSTNYNAREFLARIKAFFNVTLNSSPRFMGEEIPISGDGRVSWD